jgi:hypothetical protein
MLIVGIDILPRGDDDGRQTTGTMTIVAVGGVDDLADPAVTAMEAANPDAGMPPWIADATVAGHDRQRSVWRLAAAAAQSIDDADHVSLQAHGMLRLTIDLPLGGNPRTARTIASMRISNESGLADVSDDGAEAMEAANPPNGTAVRIGDCTVAAHDRRRSVQVQQACEEPSTGAGRKRAAPRPRTSSENDRRKAGPPSTLGSEHADDRRESFELLPLHRRHPPPLRRRPRLSPDLRPRQPRRRSCVSHA